MTTAASEQQFFRTMCRHQRAYDQIMAELKAMDETWPKVETFVTAAAAARQFGPGTIAGALFMRWMRHLDRLRTRHLRLQRRMQDNLGKTPDAYRHVLEQAAER